MFIMRIILGTKINRFQSFSNPPKLDMDLLVRIFRRIFLNRNNKFRLNSN